MRKQSPQTISEVQKIWHRVMSILYRSGGCSVKIPSSNELAREFGVARSTVRIALEKLTEEGFLVTRRGSGTFTNPRQRLNADWSAPLIGLMVLDCNLFFYSPELQGELECFFGEFRNTGWNIRLVTGQMDTPEAAREILTHSYLDGVISFGCKEFVVRAADEMMPTVSMGYRVSGVTNVHPDYSRVIRELFARTGRSRDIFVWSSFPDESRNDFLSTLRREPGVEIIGSPHEADIVDGGSYAAVRKLFSKRCPDWIAIHPMHLPELRRIVIDLYGEERARRLLWIFLTLPNPDSEWPGFTIRADRRAEVRAAIDILRRKLGGEAGPIPDFAVEGGMIF